MPWVESASEMFVARHDARDAEDAHRVLAQLEHARLRLEERFDARPGELAVVLHSSPAQLDAAQPWLPVFRRLTAPAARRYVVGWAGPRELHVLSPRLLAHRASNVEGSLEMLMLAPAALLGRRYGAEGHPPPPGPPRRCRRRPRRAGSPAGRAGPGSSRARRSGCRARRATSGPPWPAG